MSEASFSAETCREGCGNEIHCVDCRLCGDCHATGSMCKDCREDICPKDVNAWQLNDKSWLCYDCQHNYPESHEFFEADFVPLNQEYWCSWCGDNEKSSLPQNCINSHYHYQRENPSCGNKMCVTCYNQHEGRCYPCEEKEQAAESFNAPYAGAGALMPIKGDTALSSFSGKELAESSAIHGDFNQASLNYSGHQNLEVRGAETDEEKCSKCENVFDESEYFPIECVVCKEEVCKECSAYQRDENNEWDWDKPTCFDCLYPDQKAESFGADWEVSVDKLTHQKQDFKVKGKDYPSQAERKALSLAKKKKSGWKDYPEGAGFAEAKYDARHARRTGGGAESFGAEYVPKQTNIFVCGECDEPMHRQRNYKWNEQDYVCLNCNHGYRFVGIWDYDLEAESFGVEDEITVDEMNEWVKNLGTKAYFEFCYRFDIDPEDAQEMSWFIADHYDEPKVINWLEKNQDKYEAESFEAEHIMVKCDSCGKEKEKDGSVTGGHRLSRVSAFPSRRPAKGFRYCSRCDEHICDACRLKETHAHFDRTGCESHDMVSQKVAKRWKKEMAAESESFSAQFHDLDSDHEKYGESPPLRKEGFSPIGVYYVEGVGYCTGVAWAEKEARGGNGTGKPPVFSEWEYICDTCTYNEDECECGLDEYFDAESFGAEYGKRQRFGNRYVARNTKGEFISNVGVGASLKADRRNKSKTPARSGFGHRGDIQKGGATGFTLPSDTKRMIGAGAVLGGILAYWESKA